MQIKKWLFTIVVVLTALSGCSKPESFDDEFISGELTAVKFNTYSIDAKSALLTAEQFPSAEELCNSMEYDLFAGQTTDIGDVLVGNDNDSLYIRIFSDDGFRSVSENIKIWLGSEMPFEERPPSGSFDHKFTVASGENYFYISFSLAELEITCEDQIFIVIHVDAPGGETAYAGTAGTMHQNGAWWYHILFNLECCTDECDLSASAVVTDVKCYGAATGSINLTVSGGTEPFSFIWSNGATTEDLVDVPAGTYEVTITDADQCEFTLRNIVVAEPPTGISASRVVTNISAYGAHDGAIDVTVSGGTPPYGFLWNDDVTTEDRSGLGPGEYSVIITDANGCNAFLSAKLSEKPEDPEGIDAFGRKTYDQMVHCFLSLDLNSDGTMDFDTWGWTNGAMAESTSERTYELFVNADGCDVAKATMVGVVRLTYMAGEVNASFELFPGYEMSETSLYVGNDILPEDGGVYTTDPSKYTERHTGLGAAVTDSYSISGLSGSIYVIAHATILP